MSNYSPRLLLSIAQSLTLFIAFMLATTSYAFAGSISGKVTDSNGVALANIEVQLQMFNDQFQFWEFQSFLFTDNNGEYGFLSLSANNYRISFNPGSNFGYPAEFYDDVSPSQNNPTTITITDTEDRTGVDAQLTKQGITGVVTYQNGDPVNGLEINIFRFFDSIGWQFASFSSTDLNGQFEAGLENGTYRILAKSFNSNDFTFDAYEFYEDTYQFNSATDIMVNNDQKTADIAFGGNDFGSVSGRVTDNDGNGIDSIVVEMIILNGFNEIQLLSANTDSNGDYVFPSVPPNEYIIYFRSNGNISYISEYYDDSIIRDSSTPVIVGINEGITDIDAQLDSPAMLSGVVKNEAGDLLSGLSVELFEFNIANSSWQNVAFSSTDVSGVYNINAKAGTYRLKISDFTGGNGLEYYQNAISINNATDIVLSSGQESTVDITFGDADVGSISGIITDNDDNPVQNVLVQGYEKNGDVWEPLEIFANTDSSGAYTLANLPPQDYRLIFRDFNNGLKTEYYNDSLTLNNAETISLAANEDLANINAQLDKQAFITGTIKDSSMQGLSNVSVTLFSYDATTGQQTFIAGIGTNFIGEYRLPVEPGTYRLQVTDFDGNGSEYYQDAFTIGTATDIVVGAGAEFIADVVLGDGDVGSISGLLTDENDNAIENSFVAILLVNPDGSAEFVASVFTDNSGIYSISNLPAGEYIADFNANGYVREFYNNTSDFSNAEKIILAAGEDKTGINAELVKQGVSGFVTKSDGSIDSFGFVEAFRYEPFSSSWQVFSGTGIDENGYYALGLPEGTYRVRYFSGSSSENEFYLDANTVESAIDIVISAGTDRTINVILGAPDIVPDVEFSLDIDGDGSVAPLTDGLLVLRSLFGFSGDALVNGAIGGSATRTSSTDIQDYIQAGKDTEALDIDADGVVAPLTDGLLILRKLFGFSGDALINGATGTGANRSTAIEINSYLESLSP